jgi:hypothetical protein
MIEEFKAWCEQQLANNQTTPLALQNVARAVAGAFPAEASAAGWGINTKVAARRFSAPNERYAARTANAQAPTVRKANLRNAPPLQKKTDVAAPVVDKIEPITQADVCKRFGLNADDFEGTAPEIVEAMRAWAKEQGIPLPARAKVETMVAKIVESYAG